MSFLSSVERLLDQQIQCTESWHCAQTQPHAGLVCLSVMGRCGPGGKPEDVTVWKECAPRQFRSSRRGRLRPVTQCTAAARSVHTVSPIAKLHFSSKCALGWRRERLRANCCCCSAARQFALTTASASRTLSAEGYIGSARYLIVGCIYEERCDLFLVPLERLNELDVSGVVEHD